MANRRRLEDIFNESSDDEEFAGFGGSDIEVGNVETSSDEDSDSDNDEERQNVNPYDVVWTDVFGAVDIEEFTNEVGPVLPDGFDVATATPLDYFLLFLPNAMISDMTRYTNEYYEWRVEQPDHNENESRTWSDMTDAEMKAYIGMNIYMGVNSLPRYDMYWSKDEFIGNEGIKRVMTCNRYEIISKYFHVSDRRAEPEVCEDKLYKVRPLMDTVRNNFRDIYHVHREGTIDEAMIAFQGRLSYKQYMPAKPIKRGIKVWMRCDATNAYLADFDVYLGRRERPSEKGLGYDVVRKLTQDIEGSHHHMYFDNYFTSVPLMKDLLDNETYACGTVRTNKKYLSNDIKRPGRMGRGESKIWQETGGNLTATVWKDKKVVTVLSTLSDPNQMERCRRREGNVVHEVEQPASLHSYNKFMNGVDRHDQMRMKYGVGRFAKKAWKYLTWFFINCSIVNAFIIYQEVSERGTKRGYKHLDFRLELAKELIGNFTCRKRRSVAPVPNMNALAGIENIQHVNVRMDAARGVKCVWHKMQGKRKEIVWGCKTCNVHLCKDVCHHAYHEHAKRQRLAAVNE